MLGGQQAWRDYAALLAGRMVPLQVHVQPDWLYCVCARCGWELELGRGDLAQFRYTVATHDCSHQEIPVAAAAPELVETLF